MMKKDGKEIYTFTGLISRMDACRNRDYRFTDKDIPEEVEFKGTKFILTNDKTAYVNPENGESLAETVAVYYGGDLNKYLTEHEFIVTPKKKIFLTSEEREFLRLCNLLLGHDNAKLSKIIRRQCGDSVFLGLIFFSDQTMAVAYEEWFSIAPTTFLELEDASVYSLRDLKIYE